MTSATYCAIDFGTSNSAIAVARRRGDAPDRARAGLSHHADGGVLPRRRRRARRAAPAPCEFGRAAIAAYVDGIDGRLMRSMKSILGSSLVEQTTDVGGGRGVRFLDIVATYLRHLKRARRGGGAARRSIAPCSAGRSTSSTTTPSATPRPRRRCAARRASAGFREIVFQYEPIAAAFDHEQAVTREEKVLVADIGGGTSDFSLVRVGPERKAKVDRKDDILANHGVHIAGTDFDRRIELASILPLLGYGAYGPSIDGAPPREVPSAVYFDLATWHLINTVYNPQRVVELRGMRSFYADPAQHRRLMTVVERAPTATTWSARAEARQDRRRRRRPLDDRPRSRRGRAGERARRGRGGARARRRPRSHRRGGARRPSRRPGWPPAPSTRSTSPAARPASTPERAAARGLSRRAPRPRRSLRQRRDRPGAVRAASLRRSARRAELAADAAQSASTAAIARAVASTLPRVQPGDAHPPRAHQVDRELLAQAVDLARRQAGVAEHAALAEEVAEVATRHLRGEHAVQRLGASP